MTNDSLSPCFRCQAFIPTDGPATCASCSDGVGVPAPGWERRLLDKWIADKARDWRRKATRFEGRTRGPNVGSPFARAATIYIARLRRAADVLSQPVTEREWEVDP